MNATVSQRLLSTLRCCWLALALATLSAGAQVPEWIWHNNKGAAPADDEVRFFRKSFQLDGAAQKAILTLSCDNQASAFLNGKNVASNREWTKATIADVTKDLRPGDNLLAIRGKNSGGDAAVIARLEITMSNGQKRTVVTDSSWSSSASEFSNWFRPEFSAADWSKAISRGKLGIDPWGDVMAPRIATPVEKIIVLPGFKVELVRSAEPDEGSWVSMTLDDKGRLIFSPQEGTGNMLRATLNADGQISKIEKIDLAVGSGMGLLYAFDSLYVSGKGPQGLGLYRLKDANGDDRFDQIQFLKKFDGAAGEHGSHALVLGPDHKIYYMHGNFVKVPDDISATSPHRNYAEDQLLPRAEDGNGFGVGVKPPGGFLLRSDSEGKNWEMVAAGMRNAYDFDFNSDGEMFTYDSDMEWDWGMPWYRPTRIYHLVSGGDYGFREGTAKYPAHYPDSLPPTLDAGIGSPTGVKFGTHSRFPAKYQKALYAMDWSYGRIFAIHLTPKGATYSATYEDFVRGKPLNVTDMEVGPDGAMYFLTGGRGTQSGLYRVTYVGGESTERVADSKDKEGAEARALRRQLEAYHGKKDSKAIDFAWPHLNSPDRWIRYAARMAIESQDLSLWQDKALQETRPNAAITALLALARTGNRETLNPLLESLGQFGPDDLSEEQKLESLRVLSLAFIRMGKPEEDVASEVISVLNPLYPTPSDRLNRELAQVLIYLEAPNVVERTLALLNSAKTQEDQIHYLFHLRTLKSGWSMDQRREYFSWFQRSREGLGHPSELLKWFDEAGRSYGDGSSFPKFIANIRNDAVETLSEKEKAELGALISGTELAAAKRVSAPRKFVKEWTVEELLPSLEQVGTGRSFAKGKEAFAAAQCISCHRFGNEGGAVGQDLTAVASRYSRRDLLESILQPSKIVSEQYQNTTITLKDGDDLTGRIVEENEQKLVLVTNPLTQRKTDVLKADVRNRQASKLSPMPEGLVNILTKEEILDLLAYLESGGKANAAAFSSSK